MSSNPTIVFVGYDIQYASVLKDFFIRKNMYGS